MEKVEFKVTLITSRSKPEYGDAVPMPAEFSCKAYWYIEWIYVPESQRQKGLASKLVTNFCKNKKRPILVYLLGGKEHHGNKLQPLFESLGFKVIAKSKIVTDMLKNKA